MTRTPLSTVLIAAGFIATEVPAMAGNPAGVAVGIAAKHCTKRPACQRGAARVGAWRRRKGEAAIGGLEDLVGSVEAAGGAVSQEWAKRRLRRQKQRRIEMLHGLKLPSRKR
ncbi:MAG: hypothetical protein AAFY47_11845 [Pseudomonadota bacterium]